MRSDMLFVRYVSQNKFDKANMRGNRGPWAVEKVDYVCKNRTVGIVALGSGWRFRPDERPAGEASTGSYPV